ncbi:MAG TPA: ABC transporter permease [bacterium]|nr:ABC transporter permease [bacterium]
MKKFVLRRLLLMVPLLLGISILSFGIMQLAPGDPASLSAAMNQHIDPSYIEKLRASYGLNDPLYLQYWHWLTRLCRLDFGDSFKDGRPVLAHILERLPATLLLSGLSLALLFLLGVPLGVAAAYWQGRWPDKWITALTFFGFSMPDFWLALMMMLLFGVTLGWFPVSGMWSLGAEDLPFFDRLGDLAAHLAMPLFVTTFVALASVSQYAKTSLLEVIRQDYIRTARAKGLSESKVVLKHALRNALIPIVTLLGLSLPGLIGGSVIIESIFAWPGMGRLGYESMMNHDYPLVMGVGILSAFLTLLGNLLADIGYAWLDPRVKYD